MLLDFLTLLYILLFGGGLVLILVIIRYLRNEVWVATVDDGISHYYGVLKKDGGYAVRAKLYGSMLPMRDISKETGCRYMRMPEGLDKRIFLNSILYKTYLDGAAAEINGKAGRP